MACSQLLYCRRLETNTCSGGSVHHSSSGGGSRPHGARTDEYGTSHPGRRYAADGCGTCHAGSVFRRGIATGGGSTRRRALTRAGYLKPKATECFFRGLFCWLGFMFDAGIALWCECNNRRSGRGFIDHVPEGSIIGIEDIINVPYKKLRRF